MGGERLFSYLCAALQIEVAFFASLGMVSLSDIQSSSVIVCCNPLWMENSNFFFMHALKSLCCRISLKRLNRSISCRDDCFNLV